MSEQPSLLDLHPCPYCDHGRIGNRETGTVARCGICLGTGFLDYKPDPGNPDPFAGIKTQ